MIIPSPPTRIPYIRSIIVIPPSYLFQFVINFPNNRPYSSSLYIPPSAYQNRLQIVKRITDYYQLDLHPTSEDSLSVQLFSTPRIRHYSSLSVALYHSLYCHRLSTGPISFHYTFNHRQTLYQFTIHSPISREY